MNGNGTPTRRNPTYSCVNPNRANVHMLHGVVPNAWSEARYEHSHYQLRMRSARRARERVCTRTPHARTRTPALSPRALTRTRTRARKRSACDPGDDAQRAVRVPTSRTGADSGRAPVAMAGARTQTTSCFASTIVDSGHASLRAGHTDCPANARVPCATEVRAGAPAAGTAASEVSV